MPADNTGIDVGCLAGRYPGKVGHLYTPRPRRNPTGPFQYLPFALDNGAFKGGESWDEARWVALLKWAKLSGHRPLWALVPDVVGDRIGTLRRWDLYAPTLAAYGWPLAFAVQDGMTPEDVPAAAAVVFVGGSTEWKWRTLRTWSGSFQRVHVGRVNSYRRLWECHDSGAESCDGTGWFRGDHGSGRPWRGLCAYFEESTGLARRPEQLELIAMNGGLTHQELETWKRKAKNLDAALEYLSSRMKSEETMEVARILRRGSEALSETVTMIP